MNHGDPGEILSLWSVVPFIGMLLSIALSAFFVPRFWHDYFGRISTVKICRGRNIVMKLKGLSAISPNERAERGPLFSAGRPAECKVIIGISWLMVVILRMTCLYMGAHS